MNRVVGKLPIYKGYIVDYYVRQFRSQPEAFGIIEFIAFDSVRGGELLDEMIGRNLVPAEVVESL